MRDGTTDMPPRSRRLTLNPRLFTAQSSFGSGSAIQQILKADTESRGYVAFKEIVASEIIHVIPVRELNAAGERIDERSILDLDIHLKAHSRTGSLWLADFCEAVSRASGKTLVLLDAPLNLTMDYQTDNGGNGQARELLKSFLDEMMVGQPATLSWQILYDPERHIRELRIYSVDDLSRQEIQ